MVCVTAVAAVAAVAGMPYVFTIPFVHGVTRVPAGRRLTMITGVHVSERMTIVREVFAGVPVERIHIHRAMALTEERTVGHRDVLWGVIVAVVLV